ncbi:MAG: hypothetical protein NTW87_23135 [Planctomycetota bacterium]|nr:hypothetical protein [Planctomycetota bacterium]
MRRVFAFALAAVALAVWWASPVEAASGPKTTPEMIKLWLSAAGKDFKRVKSNDTFVTFTPFANRTQNTMAATGLDGSGTVYPTLTADMQAALTRLDTDLTNLKTKQSDFSKLVTAVENALKTAVRSTAPPTIETSSVLAYAVYNAAFDGVINDKERQAINDATTAVLATPSLDPTIAGNIQTAVTAFLGGSGITKADLDLIKTDFANIAAVLKALL